MPQLTPRFHMGICMTEEIGVYWSKTIIRTLYKIEIFKMSRDRNIYVELAGFRVRMSH